MQRTIVQPADVSGDALTDLKNWLGITRANEDMLLTELIRAGIALCEAFTGQAPLQQTVEERFAPVQGCNTLLSRPVQNLVSAELAEQDGPTIPLADGDFAFSIEAKRCAVFNLKRAFQGQVIIVRVVAGLAPDWAALPSALKQGIIRMAAHHYRDREFDSDATRGAPPPASVAALWRPWRSMRLA